MPRDSNYLGRARPGFEQLGRQTQKTIPEKDNNNFLENSTPSQKSVAVLSNSFGVFVTLNTLRLEPLLFPMTRLHWQQHSLNKTPCQVLQKHSASSLPLSEGRARLNHNKTI